MIILDNKSIKSKIIRISHQINENFFHEENLVLIGIKDSGFFLAEKISKYINEKFGLKHSLFFLNIDKSSQKIKDYNFNENTIKNKNIVLIDDVLLSGKTMIYSIKHLLNFSPKVIKITVLINRSYKKFPIEADYVGMSLSTILKEI